MCFTSSYHPPIKWHNGLNKLFTHIHGFVFCDKCLAHGQKENILNSSSHIFVPAQHCVSAGLEQKNVQSYRVEKRCFMVVIQYHHVESITVNIFIKEVILRRGIDSYSGLTVLCIPWKTHRGATVLQLVQYIPKYWSFDDPPDFLYISNGTLFPYRVHYFWPGCGLWSKVFTTFLLRIPHCWNNRVVHYIGNNRLPFGMHSLSKWIELASP